MSITGIYEAWMEVQAKQQQVLSEEIEEVTEEVTEQEIELATDIVESISYILFSQGYTVEEVVEYFEQTDGDTVADLYESISDDSLLIENVVATEEYIEEQMRQLHENPLGRLAMGALRLGAKPIAATARLGMKGAKAVVRRAGEAIKSGAQAVKGKAQQLVTRVRYGKQKALPPAGGQLAKAPAKPGMGAKVKDLAKSGVKLAAGGAAFEAGSQGARKLMAGDKKKDEPKKPAPSAGGGGGGGGGGSAPAPSKPEVKQTGDKKKDMETWAKANPKLAEKLKDKEERPSLKKDIEDIKKMQQSSKQRQGAEMGGPEGPGEIDKESVKKDLEAAQKRDEERAKKKKEEAASTKSEAIWIAGYLISEGFADSYDSAYTMAHHISEDWRNEIIDHINSIL